MQKEVMMLNKYFEILLNLKLKEGRLDRGEDQSLKFAHYMSFAFTL